MSKFITDEIAEQTKQQFSELDEPVRLLLFTQPHACGACAEQRELLESLEVLSDKLSLEVYSLDSPEATEYRIESTKYLRRLCVVKSIMAFAFLA
jgi:hypothetical protein